MINRYQVFRERLGQELTDIQKVAQKALDLHAEMVAESGKTAVYLDAIALNLHGFYSGVERIFEWLARQLDGTLPQGSSWHQELLTQMTLAIPEVRPAIIQLATRDALVEFLGFRHVVRNVYTWDLEPAKVQRLIIQLPTVLQALTDDLEQFRQFLKMAGQADEMKK